MVGNANSALSSLVLGKRGGTEGFKGFKVDFFRDLEGLRKCDVQTLCSVCVLRM